MQGAPGEAEDSTLAKTTETLKGRGAERPMVMPPRVGAHTGRGAGGLQRVPLPASVAGCTPPHRAPMDPHPPGRFSLSCPQRSCHSRALTPPWPKGPGQRRLPSWHRPPLRGARAGAPDTLASARGGEALPTQDPFLRGGQPRTSEEPVARVAEC